MKIKQLEGRVGEKSWTRRHGDPGKELEWARGRVGEWAKKQEQGKTRDGGKIMRCTGSNIVNNTTC